MKAIIEPIALEAAAFPVTLLHKVLDVLGLPAAQGDVAERTAGSDTLDKVRELQRRLNVVVDESMLVDDITCVAIASELRDRGLTVASRAFTVRGAVRGPDGVVQRRQRLLAFDIDLRGVAVYETVQTIGEMAMAGAFEFLGETTSDVRGAYELTFYDWQYRRSERKAADVVVYAVDCVDDVATDAQIVGRSRMVDSDDYSGTGLCDGLDVTMAAVDGRTEYQELMAALTAFLNESALALADIAGSADQVTFTAKELDVDGGHLRVAARAERLRGGTEVLSHALLYGLARVGIPLDWATLYSRREPELLVALDSAVASGIIAAVSEQEVAAFLRALRARAIREVLSGTPGDPTGPLLEMLATALPQESQRTSFLLALSTFEGSDFRAFWTEHLTNQPEFAQSPQLISRLLLTQQLTALTGVHQPLVREILVERKLDSIHDLMGFEDEDWIGAVEKAGVPETFAPDDTGSDSERVRAYATALRATLDAAFPTRRIAKMVEQHRLPLPEELSGPIADFLTQTDGFNFATSRVDDFKAEIREHAGARHAEMTRELLTLQRVFQVSVTPDVMLKLLQQGLQSAHSIANIPQNTFIKTQAVSLGGEDVASATHARAAHIAARAEFAASRLLEVARAEAPATAMGTAERGAALTVLTRHVANWQDLFGSPDLCECQHCRSVYSPAAYLVDLLRFLWRAAPNNDGKTPLDMLAGRRPDLLHLQLSCENTNTIIPYVDLANEVMEWYTSASSLHGYQGHNTGDATADELRASPQHFDIDAYLKLKDAKYPFSLPYHQPLDVIRTYGDHLGVTRYEVMQATNPAPDSSTAAALAAESLRMSEEEYRAIAAKSFDGTDDGTAVHVYYGYAATAELEQLASVRELLARSGLSYPELVELISTRFVNPHRDALAFLERIVKHATIPSTVLYTRLEQIEAGTRDPATDPAVTAALRAFNAAEGTHITPAQFGRWIAENLSDVRQVITLYEPQSKCALDTTRLRTIESIYEARDTSGVTEPTWSRIHRFVRLQRRLKWTLRDTDVVLGGLGADDITPDTIKQLESATHLGTTLKLAPALLAVLWGHIDTLGDKSLYAKLFLNKALRRIDDAFEPTPHGEYLIDMGKKLGGHLPVILAAFRLREDDLAAILGVAEVIEGNVRRKLDLTNDALNLPNLSTIYRFAVLARALKLRPTELCTLVDLFGATPFSNWDIDQGQWVDIAPSETLAFAELADQVKHTGFKTNVLEYILRGTSPADARLVLDPEKARATAWAVHQAFAAIDQSHPDVPAAPVTVEVLTAKLLLTFQPDIVARFTQILDGTAQFETITEENLTVTIPAPLAEKITYTKATGRLVATGLMSAEEQATVKALPGANAAFQAAVDEIHLAPASFLATHLDGFLTHLDNAHAVLLNRPAQNPASTLAERHRYVYERFVPLLKRRLRREALIAQLATLIGAPEGITALLVDSDADGLVDELLAEGFSATYYSDLTWGTAALEHVDEEVDFDWGAGGPGAPVPAEFSVRWQAYLTAPATGEFTLVVDVQDADEQFQLHIADANVLEKPPGDVRTSWEVRVRLEASRLRKVQLDYANRSAEAAIQLRWKTPTTALEVIGSAIARPAAAIDRFVARATVYDRAAKLVAGFEIDETELAYLINHAADFDGLELSAPSADHWQRLAKYTSLRDTVPQAHARLTDVFAAATREDPVPPLNELKELLHRSTAWDASAIDYLVDTHFGLAVFDFANEIALVRLLAVARIIQKTGFSAATITDWGAPAIDFGKLATTAQLMRATVKAKYDDDDWLKLAPELSDRLRGHQRDALVAYLLTRPEVKEWGAHDADGLFEYLLIDVQMGACMDTSRIVQANASVQMFVNRCLLNLERNKTDEDGRGVSPEAIDKDRWQWMKAYRVWEANRKTFLYPENWLDPEWRRDRSELFRALESHLVHNDITDRTVEEAFRGYLTGLNEVANLDVCGMHREDTKDGSLLHVFARTHNAPYKFYYRRWNEHRKWSAWEKVSLDVRCIEAGDDSGVHLVPVVWKGRLFLFWPEFREVQEPPGTGMQSAEEVAEQRMSKLAPRKHWELRLAWGERIDGKWSPKQVSKEIVTQNPEGDGYGRHAATPGMYSTDSRAEKDLLFTPAISDKHELTIRVTFDRQPIAYRGEFRLADITAPVRAWNHDELLFSARSDFPETTYRYKFNKRSYTTTTNFAPLELQGLRYLATSTNYELLPVDTMEWADITLDDPMFFRDKERTYFIRPVEIPPIITWIRLPDHQNPWRFGLTGQRKDRTTIVPRTARKAAIATLPAAFGGHRIQSGLSLPDMGTRQATGLEFHTFHHPASSEYVERLNRDGLAGLLAADTTIPSDEGATFESIYHPNFTHGLVQKLSDLPAGTYYKANVCFDPHGANSSYNWELFFHAPLYIATRLSRNGMYEESMRWFHFIFDPTTDAPPDEGESKVSRYWKVLPFKTTTADNLEDWFRSLGPNDNPAPDVENATIKEWRDNPFDPHLVASNRPLAYMKNVVLKYVENLVAWGDSLFRQDTMESVNEALQLYVIAGHVLGPRPQVVPKRGEVAPQSFATLQPKLDDFSNALVALENLFPYASEVSVGKKSPPGSSLLGVGPALYFCIPTNDKLLEQWDTVADRLYKIRHCQNIEGVERRLALFAPPIDPGAIVAAMSRGLSLGSILAELSSPPPIHRFSFLIQRANEFCNDVKALGAALLAALEKRDGEELSRLRASHEVQILELATQVRERQVLDAKARRDGLLTSRDAAEFRLQHYLGLLGNDGVRVPAEPSLPTALTEDSQLPADTLIAEVQTDVDTALVDSEESGVKLIKREKQELDDLGTARGWQIAAQAMHLLAATAHIIPTVSADGTPLGVGATVRFGGTQLGNALNAAASGFEFVGSFYTHSAAMAQTNAGYIRREQEWTLQANVASKEIIQIDKQITSADIQLQVAQKELELHRQQIENTKAVEVFLQNKFTNQELYQWMREQLLGIYKQSYNLAYDLAKKAEKAYQYEVGLESSGFIQYGYWENARQGLVAGERLQLALRQLEKTFLEENRRELELTKHVSLTMVDPDALIQLRETGSCYFSVPEELFDLDFRGHYFRRIASVRLTIPCVAGPYTSLGCTLRLLNHTVRVKTTMNSAGGYEREHDDGLPIDDDRFRTGYVPVTAIATSTAQNDAGLFELNFRDDRYLPFERAGAISTWKLELSTDANLRTFDYATIADVILHIGYTARDEGGLFTEKANEYLRGWIENSTDATEQPFVQMLSMRHEFPSEWSRFLHPVAAGEQRLGFVVGKARFPFLAHTRDIAVTRIDALARCRTAGDYHLVLAYTNSDGDEITSEMIQMPPTAQYGGLRRASIRTTDAGVDLEELDVDGPMTMKLKHNTAPDFTGLATNPDEVEDLLLLVHYKVG
ncbi:neuraminidase-like domain-containing protein [Rhodococcus sp. NPDC058521]|uniref:Tc toxin subunit A-related protein n=1 Tax=Rhodococcus sp. NPDC058521 TaxID=3346536 RepID=UPI00365B3CE2